MKRPAYGGLSTHLYTEHLVNISAARRVCIRHVAILSYVEQFSRTRRRGCRKEERVPPVALNAGWAKQGTAPALWDEKTVVLVRVHRDYVNGSLLLQHDLGKLLVGVFAPKPIGRTISRPGPTGTQRLRLKTMC